MQRLSFENKIRGCLVGSAIGAGLGFSRVIQPNRFEVKQPADIFNIKLEPVGEYQEEPQRIECRKATPFIDLGVRAYLAKKGRVTPEDFADLLKEDTQLSGPVRQWDDIHTVQELLKEGMNPRLTGMGIAPCGNIVASMPAVGIYHCGDPEYAYLDGVELASVVQPRLGADWAGLCAAAIACAFDSDSTPEIIVDTVRNLAHRNNKELFYQIDSTVLYTRKVIASEEEFIHWWYFHGGRVELRKETNWIAYNPISFVLPLLERYADNPQSLMALLIGAPNNCFHHSYITAIIAGAIVGILYGVEAFPSEWQQWAEPIADPWFSMIKIVRKRLEKEKELISVTQQLTEQKVDGWSLLYEKIYGCILAGAVGNAMGSPVEGKSYWEIDKQYPGGITTILDPKRLESEDDNQMAMLLVGTYLERDGLPVMARHFGRVWQERLNRNHFWPICMGNSYDLICQGWDPRITGHWNVVTGSTVMCMEPVGVYHLLDPEYAVIDAMAISYMYQRGLDVTAAAILAAMVAEAFRPEATVESICQAALIASPRKKMRTFDHRQFNSVYDYLKTCIEVADKYSDVLASRAELSEKCLFYNAVDPLEVLGLSLAIFKIAQGDVRQAGIGGTNIGRDSDTIAGRAAMLSGALKGAKSVPEDWLRLFKPEILERIQRNADCLTNLIVAKKLLRLNRRQTILVRD